LVSGFLYALEEFETFNMNFVKRPTPRLYITPHGIEDNWLTLDMTGEKNNWLNVSLTFLFMLVKA
jgi:hypothetical protein